ncbi:MAG: methyltransferase domain-containing protein [Anaerolineae bacterium]|nr:methyltransferase domain-containing protein [Anaerolineae bacterium]
MTSSSDLLTLARERCAEAGVTLSAFDQGTATDLSRYPDAAFDAVLLMGPLYHLLDADERRRALAEAYRVVKPGSAVFAAFIARYAAHIDAIAYYPDQPVSDPDYRQIAATGLLPPRPDGAIAFTAYFAHPLEVESLCRSAGFEVIATLGVEGISSGREEKLGALNDEAWAYWVDVNYAIAQDRSTHGGAEHLLVVCSKPPWRSVLRRLAVVLAEHDLSYRVVGGASLALHGLPIAVHDIDIEFPSEAIDAAYRFESLTHGEVVLPVAWRERGEYRSHFGTQIIDGVKVEIMAGLERRVGDHWLPSFLTTHETTDLEGTAVHTLTLEEEALSYLRAGRLDRVALVLPHCDPDRLLALLAESVRRGLA